MFSRSVIVDSISITISVSTSCGITYDCHFDVSRGVIYYRNIFITQATTDYHVNFRQTATLLYEKPIVGKFQVCQTHIITYLRSNLAPSNNCSVIFRPAPPPALAGKVGQENNVSIAQMGLTNLQFDQLGV